MISLKHSLHALLILVSFFAAPTFASQVKIAIKNHDFPANDLTYPTRFLQPQQKICLVTADQENRKVLSPTESKCLREHGYDISYLEPASDTNLWKPEPDFSQDEMHKVSWTGRATTTQDDQLAIDSGDTVHYINTSVTPSNSGRLKFNAETRDPGMPAHTFSIILAKNLHTYLLRKELLRKLGYEVPAMKYLDRIKVEFNTEKARDDFLTFDVPYYGLAKSNRWVVPKPTPLITDPLTVTLQDVVAIEATPLIYNVAISPPISADPGSSNPKPEKERILRSLAMLYGIANFDESVNNTEWTVGNIQSEQVIFNVMDNADFALTMDDALWALRKIALLTRQDYEDAVRNALFPAKVAKVVVEKLLSRRDCFTDLFKVDTANLAYDPKISDAPEVVHGKIIQQEWPGYASHFALGDPDSPVRKIGYYILSELEGNALENLISLANAEIPSLNTQNQSLKHQQQLVDAMTTALQTGQPQAVGIQAWTAPIVDGGLDVSRNVVMGNYLGTNNLIQMADTFGFHLNLGMMIAFDNVPTGTTISGMIQGGLNVSFAHIKPITSLKQALVEPFQNIFVPWLFGHTSKILKNVSRLENNPGHLSQEKARSELIAQMDTIKKYLEVGESLILTESISGVEQLSVSEGFPVPYLSPSVGVSGGLNQLVLSRVQFYRKDGNTIQVFKDNGQLIGVNASFGVNLGVPVPFTVLNLTAKANFGHGKSKIFNVNINPDSAQNPAIYASANALSRTLATGSVEILEELQPHGEIETKFIDAESQVQALHYVHRTLKTTSDIKVTLADGTSGDYIFRTKGKQEGKHYQLLATQVANYLVNLVTVEASHNTPSNLSNAFSINTQANPNPGQSFLGDSHTRDAQYQARVIGKEITSPFTAIQYRWEGWNISSQKLIAQTDALSQKYGATLYPKGFINDATSVKLYQLALQINIYEPGLNAILEMSESDQQDLVTRYNHLHKCFLGMGGKGACPAIVRFNVAMSNFRRHKGNARTQSRRTFKIASSLEQFVSFEDLVKIVGGHTNIYLSSSLNGFRTGSETLSNTIYSNTIGLKPVNNPDGVLSGVQSILGIESGEFNMKWLRSTL